MSACVKARRACPLAYESNSLQLEVHGDSVFNQKLVEIAGGSRLSVMARLFTSYSQSSAAPVIRPSFGSSRFDVDVIDHAHFDLVTVAGDVALGGVLVVDFTGTPELGSYRILTADAVSGSFGTLQSNLDPALYRVDAVYGATYVDLNVSAVPEPASLVLMLARLAALGSLTSAGARPRCRRPGSRS